jgi:hypothetical protein
MDKLEIEILTPVPSKEANDQIATIGLDMFNLLQTFEHIRKELEKNSAKKPHIMWQLIRSFIFSLSTDTNQVHSEIVRAALNSLPNNPLNEKSNNKIIVSLLAGKLNESCEKLKLYLIEPEEFNKDYNIVKKEGDEAALKDNPLDNPLMVTIEFTDDDEEAEDFESIFIKDKMFIWDHSFLRFLDTFGKTGKETSKNLKPILKENFKNFKATKKSPLDFWFNLKPTPEKPFYLSTALQVLAQIIWEEEVSKNLNLINTGVAALPTDTHDSFYQLLSHQTEVDNKNLTESRLYNQKKLIGLASIAFISSEIIPVLRIKKTKTKSISYAPKSPIQKGMEKLNTVTCYKLICFLVNYSFLQTINSKSCRLILERGPTELAELLELKGKQNITDLNDLLHAFAYGKFDCGPLQGNLISLSTTTSYITGRKNGKYIITPGSPFLPYQTYEAKKRGESGLLIPIVNNIPLIPPNQYYMSQCLLNMLIMAELSKQSVELVKNNNIKLSELFWKETVEQCNLPLKMVIKIIKEWIEKKFIEKENKLAENLNIKELKDSDILKELSDFYTLGLECDKQLVFLKDQGKLRIKQSNSGKVAQRNRKILKTKNKQYSKNVLP